MGLITETAEIACRAALIGRLVLSTLHTRSADAAVTRLVDLGVERYLVEDVLIGVLGQRLSTTVQKNVHMPNRSNETVSDRRLICELNN